MTDGNEVTSGEGLTGGAGAGDGARAPGGPAEPDAAHEALVRRIYDLADAGRSTLEIARQLDEPVGEVELILALRQQD